MLKRAVQQGYAKILFVGRLYEDVLCSKATLRCCVRQGYVKTCCAARLC